jgi:16S rRNA A1518/A1519 N6-dimethyltransferase RsmA/KsgA/DIM1 with predicted DNA glycosylase/AP lyase activity
MDSIVLRHEEDAFYTHQPVLLRTLKESIGAVLELGCGEGSTELIHRYCAKHGREVVTVEHDASWMSRYISRFATDWHTFIHTTDWYNITDELSSRKWGLVFIDQTSWNERAYSFKRLRDCADYIVLHDCDYFPENGLLGRVIKPYANAPYHVGERCFSAEISHWKEFHPIKPMCWTGTKMTGPPTLIASNKYPCENIMVDFSIKEESF